MPKVARTMDAEETVVMQHRPFNPSVEALFGAWGRPKDITSDAEGIHVQYEGNYVLHFVPMEDGQ